MLGGLIVLGNIFGLFIPVELVSILVHGLELGLAAVFHTLGNKTICQVPSRLTARLQQGPVNFSHVLLIKLHSLSISGGLALVG